MTQRVLICNFQYYIVTRKKKLTDFLFFSLLVAYGIPLCNC